MDWTEKQIIDTLRYIEQSDYDEVTLEVGDFRLHVRKRGAVPAADGGTLAAAPRASQREPASVPAAAAAATPAATPAAKPKPAEVPPGMIAIRAPMIGTFYRAPAPHLPPFVEEQATVKADDTVCLIEVMKLFNTIKAGVDGKVVKILAQNAAPVEKDEVLIIIEPAR